MKKIGLFLISLLVMPSLVFADESDSTKVDNGSYTIPIGTVSVYAGVESASQLLEKGYLIADGSSLLRTEYPELFAIIGTTYGNVDATHFNLPNLKGRTAVGLDTADNDFKTLGKTGGEKSVTLTVDQMPSHTHTFTGTSTTTSVESNTHDHTFAGTTSEDGLHSHLTSIGKEKTLASPGSGTALSPVEDSVNSSNLEHYNSTSNAGAHTHTFTGTTSSASASHKHTFTAQGTNSETGGGKAHNNLQPYIALKYMIKVK